MSIEHPYKEVPVHLAETPPRNDHRPMSPIDWGRLRVVVARHMEPWVDMVGANKALAPSRLVLSRRGGRLVVEDHGGHPVRVYDYDTAEELSGGGDVWA